jgi:hypothetical protein
MVARLPRPLLQIAKKPREENQKQVRNLRRKVALSSRKNHFMPSKLNLSASLIRQLRRTCLPAYVIILLHHIKRIDGADGRKAKMNHVVQHFIDFIFATNTKLIA